MSDTVVDNFAYGQSITDSLVSAADENGLKAFVDKIVINSDSRLSNHVARQIMLYFARAIKSLAPPPNCETFENVASYAIDQIKNQPVTYDEADFVLRDSLFDYYVAAAEFAEAASVLSGLNLDSTSRVYSDAEKVDILVKISEVYLEDMDNVEKAENFVSRAAPIMNSISDVPLQLRYRTTSARVLDLNRKFVDAAQRFYELSTMTNANIETSDLLELLGKAVTCAVLGKVGQPRTRIMGLLYNDPRLSLLDDIQIYSSHSAVLAKMYNEQILKYSELLAFEGCLMPHQKSMTADKFTLAQKAVVEHNIVATGKIYSNIFLSELAHLLHLDIVLTEKVASKMITEERLYAIIDQSDGVLEFLAAGDNVSGENEDPLNRRIKQICADITVCEELLLQQVVPMA